MTLQREKDDAVNARVHSEHLKKQSRAEQLKEAYINKVLGKYV